MQLIFVGSTIVLVVCVLFGLRVMKRLSAVHVVVVNNSRSLLVWAISLAASWQTFQALQIVGFLFIVLGVLVFNDILFGNIFIMYNRSYHCFYFTGPLVRKYFMSQKKSLCVSSDLENSSSENIATVESKTVIKVDTE